MQPQNTSAKKMQTKMPQKKQTDRKLKKMQKKYIRCKNSKNAHKTMEKKEQTNNKWGLRIWEFVGNMGRMLQNTRKSRSKIMIPECKTWSTQHLRMFLLQLCFSSCVSRRFLLLDLDLCINCKTGPCAKTSSMLEWASQLIKYWTYRIYLASSNSLHFLGHFDLKGWGHVSLQDCKDDNVSWIILGTFHCQKKSWSVKVGFLHHLVIPLYKAGWGTR